MASEEQKRDVVAFQSQHTLDYYVEKRADNKRNYIFRFQKAQNCDHPTMKIVARGGNIYRCPDCNYTFQWPGAIVWPQHFNVIMSAFTMLNFAKEYGLDSLNEVLRRPIGQTDGTPHKPVLPEGLSFYDTIHALEAIDTSQEDGGQQQLLALVESLWVSPQEHRKWLKEHHPEQLKALEEGHNGDSDEAPMPALPVGQSSPAENGSEGEPSSEGT
tara:strand:+ start:871 stop:1515 length:645 start_codon:yes stop_codon:yes gene_type:complete